MTKDQVLLLLREQPGAYLSGEELSRRLGISRTAVWKAVSALRQEGYGIDSAPNRGYRLTELTADLRPAELREALRGCHMGREIAYFPVIDSTNNEVKRRAVAGTVDGLAAIADQQTGGRGRRGRSFVSPPGKGLYLSAAMKPMCTLEAVSSLTAWTAVALCDAIALLCGVRPGIKWPNDLVLDHRKLCGILTEMEVEAETAAPRYVVIGAGINLTQTEADFGAEVAPVAVSLQQVLDTAPDRTELAAAVLRALDDLYHAFPREKARYLAAFRRDCLTLGSAVRVVYPDRIREGQAVDVDDAFGLVVRWEDGTCETVTSGEVSVRGLYEYI